MTKGNDWEKGKGERRGVNDVCQTLMKERVKG